MNRSNAVFVIGGVIGIIFGVSVSVLSFPLLLRAVAPEIAETPAQTEKPSSKVSEAVNTDGSDIIKELEADFPSRKAVRVQSAYTPGPERNIATSELVHAEAPAPVGPKIVIEADARRQPLPEELAGRLRKAGLADIYPAKPSPPASTNIALAPAQVAESGDGASGGQRAGASRAASAPSGRLCAPAFGPGSAIRPRFRGAAAGGAVPRQPPAKSQFCRCGRPCSRIGRPGAASSAAVSQSPVTSTQEGYAPETKWTPNSCDNRAGFW